MNNSVFRINLDIHRQTTQAHLEIKKGDTARKIMAALSDGGRPYRIDEGCYAVFKGKKSDGNVLYNDCTVENNCIVYEFTEQTAASAGYMPCEFQIYGADGQIITSPKFAIIVSGLVYDDSEVESSSEFTALAQAMTDLADLKANGLKGDEGDSAYEVAVEDGFEGTPGEWLESLRGPEGPEGPMGKPQKLNIDREDDGNWSTDEDYDTILQEHSAGREIGCNLEMSDETRLYVPFARWDGETFAFSTVYDGKEWRVEISKGDDGETSVQVVSDAYGVDRLPEYSEADHGKVLGIVDGSPAWVEATVSGGGDTPVVPGSHGIVWDLVNVTSSNAAVSVTDGASLVAVLTAEDDYTLGDVIVTMGGEVLTGVWNADTATITIASVTGDVIISCVGFKEGEAIDTSPKIAAENTAMTSSTGVTKAWEGLCVTEPYTYTPDIDTIKASDYYDAENDYVNTSYVLPGIKIYNPGVEYYEAGYATSGLTNSSKCVFFRDGVYAANMSAAALDMSEPAEVQGNLSKSSTNSMYANSIVFVLSMLDKDDAYVYWCAPSANAIMPVGVRDGDIIFAGKNSPYYGMTNIDGATGGGASETAIAEAIDNDYAQNYEVATLSLITNDAESLASDTGLDAGWAAAVETAKNAWMLEANGNFNKIPLIIHTDQHGRYSKPLYDTISKIVNWYDISKVVNLGDTVNAWVDADANNPLTACSTLETYLEATKNIPNSKRIEVFGNHDVWGQDAEGNNVGYAPQNHLRKYFRNIYARCCDNHGNFVVKDDTYNIKYLVVSAFAFDFTQAGRSTYAFAPDSLRWIISEMEKVDGYDVIILSHVPLGATNTTIYDPVSDTSTEGDVSGVAFKLLDSLWSARRDKTSGSVTDAYGNTFDFDFTACDGALLCGLHGHYHSGGYYYIGNLLDAYFRSYNYCNNEISFVLVDRENRRLNVWRVDRTPQVQNYQIPLDKPAE